VVTSDFKFIFMNELYNIVGNQNGQPIDMPDLALVEQAIFVDQCDLLITGGKRGVYIHKFAYEGKYEPKLAA
jgi:hypothetical protein